MGGAYFTTHDKRRYGIKIVFFYIYILNGYIFVEITDDEKNGIT